MPDFNLPTKDKYIFAKEFTLMALQNDFIPKSTKPDSAAKHVAEFYNALVAELDKSPK